METTPDLLPVEYLHDHTAEVLQSVAAGGAPVWFGTQDHAVAVLVSAEELKRLKAIETGVALNTFLEGRLQHARAGNTVTHEEAMAKLDRMTEEFEKGRLR